MVVVERLLVFSVQFSAKRVGGFAVFDAADEGLAAGGCEAGAGGIQARCTGIVSIRSSGGGEELEMLIDGIELGGGERVGDRLFHGGWWLGLEEFAESVGVAEVEAGEAHGLDLQNALGGDAHGLGEALAGGGLRVAKLASGAGEVERHQALAEISGGAWVVPQDALGDLIGESLGNGIIVQGIWGGVSEGHGVGGLSGNGIFRQVEDRGDQAVGDPAVREHVAEMNSGNSEVAGGIRLGPPIAP